MRYMDAFDSLPPVRVQAGTRIVVDGYHRVEAAVRLGLEAVSVDEEPIPDEELTEFEAELAAEQAQR